MHWLLYRQSVMTKSCVTKTALGRLESEDGTRWAIARAYKVSEGFGRWGVVFAWTLKERVNGKVVTLHAARSEEAARAWVAEDRC